MDLQGTNSRRVHFIGIGGIGMSALARYFLAAGWNVSGSDIVRSGITDALRREGIRIMIGHKKETIRRNNPELVIYNRAIHFRNPELAAARRLGLRVLPYAEALGELTKRYRTIAITGSHGKSTTTALAALVLMKAGLDPTVLIGTNLKELRDKNIRTGKGPYLVLEADDFAGAFLHYSPAVAIVTNIDREHLDFYGGFGELKRAFVAFLARTKPGGAFILNRDDGPLFSLRGRIRTLAAKNGVKAIWYSSRNANAKQIKAVLKIPGGHNLSNAVAAYTLGKGLAIPKKKILSALRVYNGAWRRMEYRGTFGHAAVYDDYAHHPTEIKATLAGFREKFPGKRLVCVFQPHQAKRLGRLFEEFKRAFRAADATIILPLYRVPGRDEKVFKTRDSAALVRAMRRSFPGKFVLYLKNPARLKAALRASASRNDVIIMMGAGDIVKHTDSLVK